jgi:uncharacterized protein
MSAEVPWPLLGAALAAGVAGSAHCFAMCGGIAGALGMHARHSGVPPAQATRRAVLYQLGRVAGYTGAGALVGALSQSAHGLMQLIGAGALLRIAAGVLTLLIAVRMLSGRNFLAPLERTGVFVWRRLQPLAHRAARGTAWHTSLLVGLLWGWLPCGMVYSMLLMAATSGSFVGGAAIMASFGLGTLPAMLASTWLASRMPRAAGGPAVRAVSGTLLAIFGVWMLVQQLLSGGHVHAH